MDNISYAFDRQHQIGTQYEQKLDEFFKTLIFVYPATAEEQRKGIDRWFVDEDEDFLSVEYKTDLRASRTGNAFVETVSVDSRNVLGWVYTSRADVLCYFVPGNQTVWLICMVHMREHLPDWLSRFPVRKIPNKDYCTHGLLVPVKELSAIAFQEFTNVN